MTASGRARWTTRARYTALGQDGFVRIARVAEWFQEAAVYASAAGGYPPARYEALGASWFVRELSVVVDRPVAYGEAITVETWISDLRRFRSHREYRAFGEDGAVVARGRADWLLLTMDPVTRKVRPRVPDAEMLAAFPIVDERVIDAPLDFAPVGGDPTSTGERTVRRSELDWHDHVNHTAYVAWLQDLSLAFRHVRIRYEKDARPDDTLRLEVWTQEPGRIIHVSRGGERILIAATTDER